LAAPAMASRMTSNSSEGPAMPTTPEGEQQAELVFAIFKFPSRKWQLLTLRRFG
jgi:hypothetical protein